MPKRCYFVFLFVLFLHSCGRLQLCSAFLYSENDENHRTPSLQFEKVPKPGMKVRLSQYGVNNGTNALINHFSSSVKNISSSGCKNFTSYGGFLTAIFCWKNFKVRTFEPFNLTAKPAADNYLHVYTSGGSLDVYTEFSYEFLLFPIPWVISAPEGSLVFSSSNLSLSFDARLDKSSEGNPEPEVTNCRASVNLKYSISNDSLSRSVLWLIKAFYMGWDNFLKSQFCRVLEAEMKVISAQHITLQYHYSPYIFDYHLLGPMVTNLHTPQIDLFCAGNVFWDAGSKDILQESPPQIPNFESSKMGTLFLTNYVFDSFAYTAFRHGQLENIVFAKQNFSNEMIRQFFMCSCPKNETNPTKCTSIGRFLPPFKDDYPDDLIIISVNATSWPRIQFMNNKTSVSMDTSLAVHVYNEMGILIKRDALKVDMVLNANLSVSIDKNNVTFGAGPDGINLVMPFDDFTLVENVWPKRVTKLDVYTMFAELLLVGQGALATVLKVHKVPITNDKSLVELKNPIVFMENNSLIVDTDFILNPPRDIMY